MTAPVLPDRATDPAGFLLAVADLREERINEATAHGGDERYCPTWMYAGIRHLLRNCDTYCTDHEDDDGRTIKDGCGSPGRYDGPYLAAEGSPAHARAEVALWRACAAEHQRREGNVRASLGADFDSAGWRDGSPVLAAAVAAAQAYLDGGQQ